MPTVLGVDLRRELARGVPSPAALLAIGTDEGPGAGRRSAREGALARLRGEAIEMILAEGLAEGSYSYEIVPIEGVEKDAVVAGGARFSAPRLFPESGTLTAVGCGVCTLGPRLEARVRELTRERRMSLAVMLDELGTEMLFALGRRIQDRMLSECHRKQLTMGVELHSGDPGLGLESQSSVLGIANASSVGITLHQGRLMQPLKSSSVVFAVGRNLPEVRWSRCDSCPSAARCTFGRRGASAAAAQLAA